MRPRLRIRQDNSWIEQKTCAINIHKKNERWESDSSWNYRSFPQQLRVTISFLFDVSLVLNVSFHNRGAINKPTAQKKGAHTFPGRRTHRIEYYITGRTVQSEAPPFTGSAAGPPFDRPSNRIEPTHISFLKPRYSPTDSTTRLLVQSTSDSLGKNKTGGPSNQRVFNSFVRNTSTRCSQKRILCTIL